MSEPMFDPEPDPNEPTENQVELEWESRYE